MSEITYSWIIRKLECAPSENGLTNIVKIVHWTYQAHTEEKYVEISNQYPLSPPFPENYINYSELTEDIVIEWLENNLDIDYLKKKLEYEIEKSYEKEIVLPLPWIKEPTIETVDENQTINSETPVEEFVIQDINSETPVEESAIQQ